ncbi:hypothetical protein TL18_00080 [Methanobrevibacter sp. YE315]|uniref:hypothetical protein n=1 Tax=Methanobrevibacter sp. YE315 TaxID=1609968 RepID=UPI000764E1D4|nr:hypothetical protein [Methanobrevibacter sp. YE315]AMD16570.1 hypothetical protein TL18_00080 [Methanobrevibacter sp. YE315]
MALNLSPEPGVKLTKKDRAHVLKKMKQGWKANCLIPDYVFDENGDIQIASDKNRRVVKIVKIKDDGIYIENALKSKHLRIVWDKIALINKSNEVKDGLEIKMHDGKYVSFSIYNSYKIRQITQFIVDYINDKKFNNANMYN